LPILGFAVLLWQFVRSDEMPAVRRAHTVLIGSGLALAWFMSGNTGGFWTFALVWAIVLHTSFVLWGIIAMAQAMSDRMPYFPKRWL
jgi:hypothetical protein